LQHKPSQDRTQAAEESPTGSTLQTEAYTGLASNAELADAVARMKEVEATEARFTPCLDAATDELDACGIAVEDFDADTLAATGMDLVEDMANADDARVLPPLSALELGVIERDGSTVVQDFADHEEPWQELLDAVPSVLPAWSADLDDDPEDDDGVVDTILRLHDTVTDVTLAQEMVELCRTIRGDDKAGQQALRALIGRFHRASDGVRPYLMDAIEAQALGELHIHDFLLGVEQADLLLEMDAEDAVLAEKVDAFEVRASGAGFSRTVGRLVKLLGGRARTEFEAEGSLNIPVVGPLSLFGKAKLTVSRGADDYETTLHLEAGLGVGKPGKVGAALGAGYTLKARGRSGVQVANLLQLGLLDSLASCKEEPPPFLVDQLVSGSLFQLLPGLGGMEAGHTLGRLAMGRGRRSVVWKALADAFVSPARREALIESLEDGEYVESFDQVMATGAAGSDGAAAKAFMKGGIVRRIERKDGAVREADWIGIHTGGEVAVGNEAGVTAKFEMKDVVDRKRGAPPDTSAAVKLAMEGSVESGSLAGMDALFGVVGLSALSTAFAEADVADQYTEQVAGMETLLAQARAVALAGLAEKGLTQLEGVTLGLEVEAAFAPRTGTWTVAAALVSKVEAGAEGAKGSLQRKESLGELKVDPSDPS